MPTTVTEADTFPTTLEVPNDGEDADQASVLTTFVQDLADRTRWLRNRNLAAQITASSTGYKLDGFMQAAVLNKTDNVWAPNTGFWLQTEGASGASACSLHWSLPRIPNAVLEGVDVWVHGDVISTGAHGGLPAGMPVVALYGTEQGASGPNSDVVVTQTDTSGSLPAYETAHKISLTGLSLPLDTFASGWKERSVALFGEYSTNALDNRLGCLGVTLMLGV